MYKIVSIREDRKTYDYHGLNGTYREIRVHRVSVEVPSEYWHKLRANKQLGQLYGVDISNEVYRTNPEIRATNPIVSDRQRASKGIKHTTLEYRTVVKQKPKLRLVS